MPIQVVDTLKFYRLASGFPTISGSLLPANQGAGTSDTNRNLQFSRDTEAEPPAGGSYSEIYNLPVTMRPPQIGLTLLVLSAVV